MKGFRIVSQGDLNSRGKAVGLQSRPLDLRSRPLCAEPRLLELCITQTMEDGVGGKGAAVGAAGGGEEDGDSTQRAGPDEAAHVGSSSTRKRRRPDGPNMHDESVFQLLHGGLRCNRR